MDEALPSPVVAALERARVPGACLAVVLRGTPPRIWAHGRASIDPSRPATRDTVFHLFSGTKLYTATALMGLVEAGRLSLDDAIQDHLPELELDHPIRLRQLASHASGLPDTLRAFLATHLVGEPAPSAAEALARYRLSGASPPGRGVAYRNVNYAILGELIARVAGRPFPELVRARILEPLGSAASFAHTPAQLERAATGYLPRLSPMRLALRAVLPQLAKRIYAQPAGRFMALKPYELDTAAIGGLLGTVADFVPLVAQMLDLDDGLLRAESKAEMLRLQAEGAAGVVSRVGVGIGWKLGRVGEVEFCNHEGGGAGFCSETRIYRKQGLGVVLLMNRSQTRGLSHVAHEICEALRRLYAPWE